MRKSFLIIFILIFYFSIENKIQAQTTTINLDRFINTKAGFHPPINIILVKSQQGIIETDKIYLADEDWFKGLVIKVRNNSGKQINHITIDIRFPRPPEQKDKLDFVIQLGYGQNPFPTPGGKFSINTAKQIMPGESKELSLSDKEYTETRKILKDLEFPLNITNIKLSVSIIGFNDETIWLADRIYKLDRINIGKLVPQEIIQGHK